MPSAGSLTLCDQVGANVNLVIGCVQGGSFTLVLMVGDTSGSNAREWTMGNVQISPGQGGSKGKPLLQKSGALPAHFQPLPEIKHIFQQPSPRPPMLVSYIFTGVVLLPLLGLSYVLATQLGANLKVDPPAVIHLLMLDKLSTAFPTSARLSCRNLAPPVRQAGRYNCHCMRFFSCSAAFSGPGLHPQMPNLLPSPRTSFAL